MFCKLNIAIITCVWGNYKAHLRSIDHLNIDGFVFTNCVSNIKLSGKSWNIIDKQYFTHSDPYMVPKYYKTQWHKIPELINYDIIIWMDSRMEIISLMPILNNNFDIAIFKALSKRKNPIQAIRNAFKTNDIRWANYHEGLKKQKKLYNKTNWYASTGFYIAKRNETVIKTMNLWFEHIINYSPYCNLSFPWACDRTGINVLLQNWDTKVVTLHKHLTSYKGYYITPKKIDINKLNFKLCNNLKSATSNIYIDENKKFFLKKQKKYFKYDCIKREVHILKLLQKYDWAPKLIDYSDNYLITEYIGESVNFLNMPRDYKIQFKQILDDLNKNNIQHNDIKYNEVLVKDNKLYLCDFGWASINNDLSCGINISKLDKPYGVTDDKKIIQKLDKIIQTKNIYLVSNFKLLNSVAYVTKFIKKNNFFVLNSSRLKINDKENRFFIIKSTEPKFKIEYLINLEKNLNNKFGKNSYYVNKTEYNSNLSLLENINNISNQISELHVLIDWTCYFPLLENKIKMPLQLVKKIPMKKLKDKKKIISAFYNVPVDDFRGRTDFNLYLINDTNPIYDYRKTSKGKRRVNIHLFDLKKSLRKITKGCKIHATDNIQETKDNLKVLGLYNQYYNEKKFNTLNDVFNELNKYPKLKWIVMRNFEGMPDKITIDKHLDVDLLVNDYYLVKTILDGTSAKSRRYEDGKNRILNFVNINNKKVLFDFRSVGDNYYDKNLQQNMLNTRVKHPNGFYIPNPEMHLYTLIYHAIIHKPRISSTYLKVFKQYGLKDSEINKKELKKKLDTWLEKNNYQYVKPEPSVGFYLKRLK